MRIIIMAIFIIIFTACGGQGVGNSKPPLDEITWERKIHELIFNNDLSQAEMEAKRMLNDNEAVMIYVNKLKKEVNAAF